MTDVVKGVAWPYQIKEIRNYCIVIGDMIFDYSRFRRVPPPKPKPSDADRIAELERQLAEQAPLVQAARELREWIIANMNVRDNGTIVYNHYCQESYDGLGIKLIALRNAKGGDACANQ